MNHSALSITDQEFSALQRMLKTFTGISLSAQKKNLVTSRMARRLLELGFEDFTNYIAYMSKNESEMQFFVDRMTTNETYFLREEVHFEFFKKFILENPQKNLRIWSCASSNGAEAYTLSIFLKEFSKITHRILASDISEAILEKAQDGIYLEEDLRKLPKHIKTKYFSRDKDNWKIHEGVKECVTFKYINLMDDEYPLKAGMDMIFCRNVMIYFDEVTRQDLIMRIYRNLNPSGLLFLGLSESLPDPRYFTSLGNSIFQKKGGPT